MKISKRQFLAGSASGAGLLVAAGAVGKWPLPKRDRRVALAVFDSRVDVARAFARQAEAAGVPVLDVGADPESFWRRARAGLGLKADDKVIGVTSWDDWVALRAQFAENRLRVRREVRLDCCGLDPRAGHRHDLVQLTLSPDVADKRLAVAGKGGTAFAWQVA